MTNQGGGRALMTIDDQGESKWPFFDDVICERSLIYATHKGWREEEV